MATKHTEKNNKLQNCSVCHENNGKYRCPRCAVVTCSLKCCKTHKSLKKCNGIKPKVEFMKLSEMNGKSIANDLSFLMSIASKIKVCEREPLLKPFESRKDSNRFHSLCAAAKQKSIRLFIQPKGMSKHINNQSFVIKKYKDGSPRKFDREIHWTVSIKLSSDESKELLVHDLHENVSLTQIINDNNVNVLDSKITDVLLKIPNNFMFIRVDPSKSLLKILRQKIISEYPEFVILTGLKSESNYVILDKMSSEQFRKCIKQNTEIERKRNELKLEMQREMNEKQLYDSNNRYKFGQFIGDNVKMDRKRPRNNAYDNLKPRDLFNNFGEPPPIKKPKLDCNSNVNNNNNNTNNPKDWHMYL